MLVPLLREHNGRSVCELLVLSCPETPVKDTFSRFTIASFELPQFEKQPTRCTRIGIYGNSYCSFPPRPELNIPFYHDYRARVLVVSMSVFSASAYSSKFHLFVPSSVMERRYKELQAGKTVVHWEEWAAEVALIQQQPLHQIGDNNIMHMRCILSERVHDNDEGIVLYEFPTLAEVRRGGEDVNSLETLSSLPECCDAFGLKAAHLDDPNIWTKPVHTGLPFKKFVCDLPIDEVDRILLEDAVLISKYPRYVTVHSFRYASY